MAIDRCQSLTNSCLIMGLSSRKKSKIFRIQSEHLWYPHIECRAALVYLIMLKLEKANICYPTKKSKNKPILQRGLMEIRMRVTTVCVGAEISWLCSFEDDIMTMGWGLFLDLYLSQDTIVATPAIRCTFLHFQASNWLGANWSWYGSKYSLLRM